MATAALAASALIATAASATPQSGFSTELLAQGAYDDIEAKAENGGWELELRTKGASDVYVVRNTFVPGGHSGWHTHSGPSLNTVTAAQITVYGNDGLCQPRVYGVGDGSIDLGGAHVHLIKNEGTVDAKTVVTQVIPAGASRRIDAAAPTNCSF